jgi:drug/metabolite transporter (DMT)-like permease
MSPHQVTTPIAIVALKTLTLILGAAISYLAYKAYTRTGAKPLQFLAYGFGFVTLGSLLAGVIDQVFQQGFRYGQLVETTLVTVGFAVILYSLYIE